MLALLRQLQLCLCLLDNLLACFEGFKQSQEQSRKALEEKLVKFKAEFAATKESQKENTERALKRI